MAGTDTAGRIPRQSEVIAAYPLQRGVIVPDDFPEILNPRQAATLLGLSEMSILRMLRDGTLPGRKVGRQWRISKRQLLAFIESEGDSKPPNKGG
jgi:excisionase family DNA binding protein